MIQEATIKAFGRRRDMFLISFNFNVILGYFAETSTMVGQGQKQRDLLEDYCSSGKNIIVASIVTATH